MIRPNLFYFLSVPFFHSFSLLIRAGNLANTSGAEQQRHAPTSPSRVGWHAIDAPGMPRAMSVLHGYQAGHHRPPGGCVRIYLQVLPYPHYTSGFQGGGWSRDR